jgi:16S rRNA (cytidine1402-2'-O)-methyltransferase
LDELTEHYSGKAPKGEIVVLIDRGRLPAVSESDLTSDLANALETNSMRDAVDMVAQAYDVPRRQVYQAALELGKET